MGRRRTGLPRAPPPPTASVSCNALRRGPAGMRAHTGWRPAPTSSPMSSPAVTTQLRSTTRWPRSRTRCWAQFSGDGRGPRRELDLPVVRAVVPGVGAAAGVGHHDGITGVEVVEEPFRVGRADVDAAMTDVALALVIH